MKKLSLLSLLILLFLAGCGLKKTPKSKPITKQNKKVAKKEVDIPLAGSAVRSFFDDEIGEFAILDDLGSTEATVVASDSFSHNKYDDEFSWVDNEDFKSDLDIVYFDFDKFSIKPDQEYAISHNEKRLKEVVKEAKKKGQNSTIVIEGHSCSIARSRTYNLALSEKRAKVIADRLVEAGIPRKTIKVVGRGEEYPAIINGKPVTGTKEEQWINRRTEIRIIHA